jgi:hypothetical protein
MSTPTEEVTVDFDAIDAEVAKGKLNGAPAPETPTVEVETAPETPAAVPEKTTLSTEDGLKKLQKQLDDERALRIQAQNRANDAAHGEAAARTDVQKTQLDLVTSAIERVTQANDTLEDQYAAAMTAQDFKAAAKVQRQMSDNSAKLAQLEAGKNALEKAPKPTPRASVDPVEAYVADVAPQWPKSAQWLRAHPDFVLDKNKNQQMVAAHQLALARGHAVESDGYFASIEKTLDLTPAVAKVEPPTIADDDPMADAAKPVNGSGRQAAPAAPVSRSGNGGGSKPGRVTLTKDQQEAAYASFPDSKTPLEDYGRQLAALRKEGKLQ